MNNRLIAIVPAAGIGTRAQTPDNLPKQYRHLGGMPMLRRTVMALLQEPRITEVHVIAASNDIWVEQTLKNLPRTIWRFCGGANRSDTVRNALLAADLPADVWVMVHDAARPGLPLKNLSTLIDICTCNDSGGILALPVAATVKVAEQDSVKIAKTLPRTDLWLAQTPQMFKAGELLAALQATAGNLDVTDEASALELSGLKHAAPLLVKGARENFKLTYTDDFDFYERLINPVEGN